MHIHAPAGQPAPRPLMSSLRGRNLGCRRPPVPSAATGHLPASRPGAMSRKPGTGHLGTLLPLLIPSETSKPHISTPATIALRRRLVSTSRIRLEALCGRYSTRSLRIRALTRIPGPIRSFRHRATIRELHSPRKSSPTRINNPRRPSHTGLLATLPINTRLTGALARPGRCCGILRTSFFMTPMPHTATSRLILWIG